MPESAPSTSSAGSEVQGITPARIPVAGMGVISLLAVAAAAGLTLNNSVGQRYVLSLALFVIVFALIVLSPRSALPLILIGQAVLGGVRRWLIPLIGYNSNDPLLLIVPLVLIVYLAPLFMQRRIILNTALSRMMRWLLVMMAVEIFNPLQGGPLVGFAGALFYLTPVMWYFLGRQIGSLAQLRLLYVIATWVAIAGALYGFKQTWFGLAPSEQEWLRLTGFGQVMKDGSVRTLSFFTNGGEYSMFVGAATAMLWAAFLRGRRIALLPVPMLVVALVLGSYRSALVATLLSCTVLWAVQGNSARSWLPRVVVALVVGVLGLTWSLNQASDAKIAAPAQTALDYQRTGLLDPAHSSASAHYVMFSNGISSSLSAPLGRGLGVTTIAGSKYGDSQSNTEFDISNVFVALGPVGGILYIAIIAAAICAAARFWIRTRSTVALAIIGLLALYIGHWLECGGTGYILVWYSVGALDRTAAINGESTVQHRRQSG